MRICTLYNKPNLQNFATRSFWRIQIRHKTRVTKSQFKSMAKPGYFGAISTSTSDTSTSLLLNYDTDRYVFSCPDNTNRIVQECKIPLKHCSTIFVPSMHPDHVFGLHSMLFRINEAIVKAKNKQEINIIGPKNLKQYIASGRHFCKAPNITVKVKEIDQSENVALDNQQVKIYASNSKPDSLKRKREDERSRSRSPTSSSPSLLHSLSRSLSPKLTTDPKDESKNESNDNFDAMIDSMYSPYGERKYVSNYGHTCAYSQPNDTSTSFIVISKTRGKFRPDMAQEFGLIPRTDYARLLNHESVLSPSGVIVTPDQVTDKPAPPPSFIYSVCPSPEYIKNHVNSNIFKDSLKENNADLKVIVHHVGPGVLDDERYIDWLNSFGDNVEHKVSSPEFVPNLTTFQRSANLNKIFQKLDNDIFKCPISQNLPTRELSTINNLSSNVTPLNTDYRVNFGLKSLPKEAKPVNFSPSKKKAYQEFSLEAEQALITQSGNQLSPSPEAQPGDNLRVSFLGTASSTPSVYRNVSGIIIESDTTNIVFDPGEGTWGQMTRLFGEAGAQERLAKVGFIFISHLHADHHMGLARILYMRQQQKSLNDLYIFAPFHTKSYLTEQSNALGVDLLKQVKILYNNTVISFGSLEYETRNNMLQANNFSDITIVPVIHNRFSSGLVLTFSDGAKVVYSGDTMPAQSLIDAGKDATLLIHEATLDDTQKEMALSKKHSTIGQAIKVSKDMNVKYAILTHFSTRFQKSNMLSEIADPEPNGKPHIMLAYDLTSVKISDLWKPPYFIKPIETYFNNIDEDDDQL